MRRIYIYVLIFIFAIPPLKAQEKGRGFEVKLSLIHPYLRRTDYKYSTDPSLEVHYYSYFTDKFSISAGIAARAGVHNWQEITGHTFRRDDGMLYRVRTSYNRRFEYVWAGIPLKVEKEFSSQLIQSGYIKITGGSYFYKKVADYYRSEYVADYKVNFEKIFWDIQIGINRTVFQSDNLKIGLSPLAGAHSLNSEYSNYLARYFYYGLGIRLKMGI